LDFWFFVPRAPNSGLPGFPFEFSGRWRALAKGTARAGLAGLLYNSPYNYNHFWFFACFLYIIIKKYYEFSI
jgi:hypothetical protein